MNTTATVTLTAETLPLFASKDVRSGEYVEVEANDPECTAYTVRRCWMGRTEWQATDLPAAEVVETCNEWGLDGWTPALHGEE